MDGPLPPGWGWTIGRPGAWAMVLARVLGLCLTAPGLAAPGFSGRFRLGLAMMLTLALAPLLGGRIEAPSGALAAAWAGAGEVLAGAILGMVAGLIVVGARAAGDLVAAQAGLSTATFFDPEAGEEVTAIGRLYGWVAMVAYLAMGGPIAMVRALAESYAVIPAGGPSISEGTAAEVFGQVGRALELALRAAAPPAVALILAGIALAWLSRSAPSLPFLILALPIRVVVGVVLVVVGLSMLAIVLGGAWGGLLGIG